MATAEFSKFAGILSEALSHYFLGFEIAYLKIRQAGFNSTWTKNFQVYKLDLEKAEEPEIKLSTSDGSQDRQENPRKPSTSALLTMVKPLTV